MYHSITYSADGFTTSNNTKNTWADWHLIPSSRPVFAQPTVNYKYVDIPGASRQLDMTDWLIGKPTYTDRKGNFEFYVALGETEYKKPTRQKPYHDALYKSYGNWANRRTNMATFFNGRKMYAELEDDSGYYYFGRFFLKEWKSEAQFSKIIIEYQADPYRYKFINGEIKAVDL